MARRYLQELGMRMRDPGKAPRTLKALRTLKASKGGSLELQTVTEKGCASDVPASVDVDCST